MSGWISAPSQDASWTAGTASHNEKSPPTIARELDAVAGRQLLARAANDVYRIAERHRRDVVEGRGVLEVEPPDHGRPEDLLELRDAVEADQLSLAVAEVDLREVRLLQELPVLRLDADVVALPVTEEVRPRRRVIPHGP